MSTDNVVSLLGGTPFVGDTVRPEVVEALETALGKAKRGEIIGVAIVTVTPSMDITTHWRTSDGCGHVLLAGCEYLKQQIMK